jgi:signal-transduction protein with cAMP-binding, CBS, and nucleotidyltransferase domain
MTVGAAMNTIRVTVGRAHTMREAARRMTDGGVGSAIVLDPELPAPGILTERDLLHCVGNGGDLDRELVGDHMTVNVVYAMPEWPLERAAEEMSDHGFRHIIVLDGAEVAGILSMRDIVACWLADRVPGERHAVVSG